VSANPTVVFSEPKKVVIEDRPVPKPGRGEVLVKSRRSLISTGTECTILKAEFPKQSAWADWGKFPFLPGYCSVGDVIEVGPDVDKGLVGKRVGTYAGHAQYAVAPLAQLREVPPEVTDDVAVFFVIAQITFNCVRRAEMAFGESAIVYGLGLLGQIIVRALVFSGARPVFAVDVAAPRIALLPKHSSIVAINPTKTNVRDKVKEITRGRMADAVFEVTGAQALIPGEFEALRPLGKFIVASSPSGPSTFDFHDMCNCPSYTIIGAHISSQGEVETPYHQWTRARNAELYFDLAATAEMDIEKLISHKEPYTKAPELYGMLLKDRSRAMGVILEWDA